MFLSGIIYVTWVATAADFGGGGGGVPPAMGWLLLTWWIGPTVSREDIEKAQKRGGRVDEGKTGWGLGLSIVTDILEEYDGEFILGESELGGLKATVVLPGRVEK